MNTRSMKSTLAIVCIVLCQLLPAGAQGDASHLNSRLCSGGAQTECAADESGLLQLSIGSRGKGVNRSVAGRAVSLQARLLSLQFANENNLLSWVNANGTFGGENSFDFVGVVPGVQGLIPEIRMQDGPQGIRDVLSCCQTKKPRISWPAAASVGTSWSPHFAFYLGSIGSQDWLGIGANSALTPGVGVHRLPICGRSWEYVSGEDATLGALAADIVVGLQKHNLLPAVKHFAFNQQELNRGQDILTGSISMIDIDVAMETYLRAFQSSIDVGAGGFMCSYNQVQFLHNGVTDGSHAYTCGSEALMALLRNAMGYGGLVMSDWGAQFRNYTADGQYHSGREFTDWEMIWSEDHTGIYQPFNESAEMSVAVKRALTGLYLSGTIASDGKAPTPAPRPEETLPRPYRNSMAQADASQFGPQYVAETLTLLKNKGAVLPIAVSGAKILLTGEAMLSGGGSGDSPAFSYLFQDGTAEGISNNGGLVAQRLMQATLAKKLGATVTWDFELLGTGDVPIDFASFDYIVAFGSQYRAEAFMVDGKDGYYQIGRCSSMVNVSQLASDSGVPADYYGDCDYPAVIRAYADARKAGTKVVSVTTVGGVFAAFDFIDHVDAAITTFYPGQFFAEGLALVLSGNVSPGGRLTMTLPRLETLNGEQYIQSPIGRFNSGLKVPSEYCVVGSQTDCLRGASNTLQVPAYAWDIATESFTDIVQYGFELSNYSEGAFVGYKYYEAHGMKPLFPFGFGLSYADWSLAASFASCKHMDTCTVQVDAVKKHGLAQQIASHVIQVYVGFSPDDASARGAFPVKELRAFQKVWATTQVEFVLDFHTAWDNVGQVWKTPCKKYETPGKFTISVGHSSNDIVDSATVACV